MLRIIECFAMSLTITQLEFFSKSWVRFPIRNKWRNL